MKGKDLPKSFWAKACNTAIYILNRSYTKAVNGMTPLQALFGKKPSVAHFKVFGCDCFVHVLDLNLSPIYYIWRGGRRHHFATCPFSNSARPLHIQHPYCVHPHCRQAIAQLIPNLVLSGLIFNMFNAPMIAFTFLDYITLIWDSVCMVTLHYASLAHHFLDLSYELLIWWKSFLSKTLLSFMWYIYRRSSLWL